MPLLLYLMQTRLRVFDDVRSPNSEVELMSEVFARRDYATYA